MAIDESKNPYVPTCGLALLAPTATGGGDEANVPNASSIPNIQLGTARWPDAKGAH